MFVRPPVARSARNPGRRPLSNRVPMNEVNRPLLRQFIRNRRSDPRFEAYILEVREGPAVNGNTNAAASKSIPQPWVSVRDYGKGGHQIGLPVSICDALLKHLLTCVSSEDRTQVDSSEENELACGSSAAATDTQGGSPARASGDGKSPVEEVSSGENSPNKKESPRSRSKLFQLSRLQPIRIVCEATGCILEVSGRDPTAKRASANADEPEQPVPVDPSRRWIVSAPLETRTNGDQSTENAAPSSARRRHPWEARGFLELHESLMPQLSAFIADVVTRYRSVNELPEVRSLYSASGGRRFFFDLRDTRWGKRLHISQVTDLHRNVIGIPLETLVSFRTRLDDIIQSLKLDDQHTLRSEIYGVVPERTSPRSGQRRAITSSRDREELDNGTDGHAINNRAEFYGNRQRGRERRRPRVRSFTNGSGAAQQAPNRNGESASDQQQQPTGGDLSRSNAAQNGPSTQHWNGNGQRNRRFGRRPRNIRPFNRLRRPAQGINEDGGESREPPTTTSVPSAPQPAIDPGRVAQVAEASA